MVVQDPTRDNVLAHQRVNETVMQHHTVIPMSFGTVFKTEHDIMELLRSAYDAFSDVLSKMQGKVEFGLKVLWDRDQIIREIEEEEEDIRRLKGEISSQKGSTYFARMQYGRLIDAALQARSEHYVTEIFQALRDVVGRLAVEQADRRPHDHERGVPRRPRRRDGVRPPGQGHRPALRQADVQVHRAVAAVQLRQHPAEARTGAVSLEARGGTRVHPRLPLIGGLRFVLDKVATVVDTELNDDTALREQLLAAQMRVELGEMSQEEFDGFESRHPRAACARSASASRASEPDVASGDYRSPASRPRSTATSTRSPGMSARSAAYVYCLVERADAGRR